MRQIVIDAVLNGFLVKVGCQHLVFSSVSSLCSELARYFHDPEKVEKEYLTSSINSHMALTPTPILDRPIERAVFGAPMRPPVNVAGALAADVREDRLRTTL